MTHPNDVRRPVVTQHRRSLRLLIRATNVIRHARDNNRYQRRCALTNHGLESTIVTIVKVEKFCRSVVMRAQLGRMPS